MRCEACVKRKTGASSRRTRRPRRTRRTRRPRFFRKTCASVADLKHNTWRTAGPPPQSLTAVTMSAEEKKGDEKDKQINLKVKDQVRGGLSPRRAGQLRGPLQGEDDHQVRKGACSARSRPRSRPLPVDSPVRARPLPNTSLTADLATRATFPPDLQRLLLAQGAAARCRALPVRRLANQPQPDP